MVVIVSALRTPIGKYGGTLKDLTPVELTSVLMENTLSYLGKDADIIGEVVIGQTKQSAHYPNIARVAALKAGLPEGLSAYTVHRQCGSGMQAVHNGFMAIRAGQTDCVMAGGVESMSQAPYYMIGNRFGISPGNFTMFDSNTESQPKSQPEDLYGSFNMLQTAEHLAKKYGISRQEQDQYALESHGKALRAIQNGIFDHEIVPLEVSDKKVQHKLFSTDEQPRETSMEKLARLEPIIRPEGTITAGNASSRNDGAAVLMLMEEKKALSLGLTPLAKIKAIGAAGVHPGEMGLGPVLATKMALKNAGLELKDIDLIELNEAFAAQCLAVLREWNLPASDPRLNVNGGAIALGHPLGCSGARILVTLVHEMLKRDVRYGLATLCVAGGQGISTIVEKWRG
jgi:acetyl-CoA C-acetyltransferase